MCEKLLFCAESLFVSANRERRLVSPLEVCPVHGDLSRVFLSSVYEGKRRSGKEHCSDCQSRASSRSQSRAKPARRNSSGISRRVRNTRAILAGPVCSQS